MPALTKLTVITGILAISGAGLASYLYHAQATPSQAPIVVNGAQLHKPAMPVIAVTAQLPDSKSDTEAPPGLSMSADHHLLINIGLHQLFDYYLLGGLPGSRTEHTQQLQHYLTQHLQQPATNEALQLLEHYLHYLKEHDLLLEHNGNDPSHHSSLDQMRSWASQLSRLRQNELGIDVARIWFTQDHADMQRGLAMIAGQAPAQIETDPIQRTTTTLNQLRSSGASLEQQRAVFAQQFGEEAARRWDVIQAAELQWQQRLNDFRQAAQQITAQVSDSTAREQQIQTLLNSSFPLDSERLRARALR